MVAARSVNLENGTDVTFFFVFTNNITWTQIKMQLERFIMLNVVVFFDHSVFLCVLGYDIIVVGYITAIK